MSTRLFLTAAAALLAVSTPLSFAQAKKAKCVVSGKEIEVTEKTPTVYIQGKPHYFCCENCPKAFRKTPEKFVKDLGKCPIQGGDIAVAAATERKVINNGVWYVCCPGCIDGLANSNVVLKELVDPVSGKKFKGAQASPRSEYKGQLYVFETAESKDAFDKEPGKYAVEYGK